MLGQRCQTVRDDVSLQVHDPSAFSPSEIEVELISTRAYFQYYRVELYKATEPPNKTGPLLACPPNEKRRLSGSPTNTFRRLIIKENAHRVDADILQITPKAVVALVSVS